MSKFVSRRHAVLTRLFDDNNQTHYRLVDGFQGNVSANGIIVNSNKVKFRDLQNGDQIIFGPDVRAVYYALKRESILSMPTERVESATDRISLLAEDWQPPNNVDEDASPDWLD